MDGFVHIIESPSSGDLLDGRTEGRALNEVLELAQIPRWYSLVTDRKTLEVALGPRLIEAWRYWQTPPVLHLSMHGNQEGVGLTSGEFVSWHDLRQVLLPLTRALQSGLLICMSTCFGGAGCRMAMYADGEPHFWALVGNSGSPTWVDAAVAYITFYHLLFKSLPIETCVESMKVASHDHDFSVFLGQQAKASWLSHMSSQLAGLAQRLEQAAGETTKHH